jgi:hypothetical protein
MGGAQFGYLYTLNPLAPPNKLPFILFASARTGSTTLTRLLNCHPAIRCEFEPFNPGYSNPTAFLAQAVQKSQGVAAALESLWQSCNGIKHVWHTDGFPFNDQNINHQILTSGTTIILLSRKNALQRAISAQISDQMRLWVPTSDADRRHIREHHFLPLDIAKLRDEISAEQAAYQKIREQIATLSTPLIETTYEDLFAPDLTIPARIAAVQVLFQFLGVRPLTDPAQLAAMQSLFDPAQTGFQNTAAYQKIPNIREVDQQLSSPQTGLLFE